MVKAPAHLPAGTPVRGVDARLLALAAGRVHKGVAPVVMGEQLSVEQWNVLDYLHDQGPCTMSALASATGTNGATLTRIVDRLVTRALVYRNVDAGDRRRVLVHPAERGRTIVRELRPKVLAAERNATAELTESERGELAALLQRLCVPPAGG